MESLQLIIIQEAISTEKTEKKERSKFIPHNGKFSDINKKKNPKQEVIGRIT